jgi:hypothetical protein
MFGVKDVQRMGVGKVRAFELCICRDKQWETCDWNDTIPQRQRDLVQAVWMMATKMTADEVEDEVKIAPRQAHASSQAA